MAMTRAERPSGDVSASPRGRAPEELEEDRLVHDEDGHLWRVREVRFADARPSLIFESEVSFRRVRAYPADWRQLGDQELYALSWRT
jgi:hypothetical protein